MSLSDRVTELRQLGVNGALFRTGWEAKRRSGLFRVADQLHRLKAVRVDTDAFTRGLRALNVVTPETMRHWSSTALSQATENEMRQRLERIGRGTIKCFGRWDADFGNPIDWHRNPLNGCRWRKTAHWAQALKPMRYVGDIKFSWEVGRFPQAYLLARTATFFPDQYDPCRDIFRNQVEQFIAHNQLGYGIHFSSGQEIAFRMIAWSFALQRFSDLQKDAPFIDRVAQHMYRSALHVAAYIDYARVAVHNNHILSEALALYLATLLFPAGASEMQWDTLSHQILSEQIQRQFYPDGAYIQQSHNYHRVALQDLIWACLVSRTFGNVPPRSWTDALDRSVTFLCSQQNGIDGRLPNYGANDGALPSPLSCCDFSDFRPTLQTAALLSRNLRLYDEGPWDEESLWLLGPEALQRPLKPEPLRSRTFLHTGYQVLRSNDNRSFATLRCGTVRDRFSQIDMLHLDVWWRGINVFTDAGSYQYNGDPVAHNHFYRTASHNTLTIDAHDQMHHYRQFKNLHWTPARLTKFFDGNGVTLCVGEHDGYTRFPTIGKHQRSVLYDQRETWIVVDHISGTGSHAVRLHWLAGDLPFNVDRNRGQLSLVTDQGCFTCSILDQTATPQAISIKKGQTQPLRGWLSRYYGEKIAVPSLVSEHHVELPMTIVTLLTPEGGTATFDTANRRWTVHSETSNSTLNFSIERGTIVFS